MKVHIAMGEGKGPLFQGDSLMAFLDEDDAQAAVEAQSEKGFVAVIAADHITEKLRSGELERVQLVLEPDEHYRVGLKEWIQLVEAADETIRQDADQRIVEMIDRGLLGYDAETDLLYRKDAGDEG